MTSLLRAAAPGRMVLRCAVTRFVQLRGQPNLLALRADGHFLNPKRFINGSRNLNNQTTRAAVLVRPDVDDEQEEEIGEEVYSTFASMLQDEDEEEYIEVDAAVVDESLKLENLGLSAETVKALNDRGIFALFPIQKHVFEPAMQGKDMIGRARTGSGKTLAFALPVIESILKENRQEAPRKGRTPRAIIVAPTRELANQVAREFESACPSLVVQSFYGGVAAGPQCGALRRGVDVAVGTPGRLIDLIERGELRLERVRFAILDEADQMLDMGFEEDMETILRQVPENRQTMLFSATLPHWINKVARRYLKTPTTVDLVGEQNTGRLAETIRCLVMQVDNFRNKLPCLNDVLSVHAAGGKAMVFTKTKAGADEVAASVASVVPCEALHGDIPQAQREASLARFREGKFSVLVATDVAARGLDIPHVDLVVHFDLPQDSESFLHRSGRTGRANKSGTTVVMYTPADAQSLGRILKDTKTEKAEQIGAPDPAEILSAAAKSVLNRLDKVEGNAIEFFVPAAEKLLSAGQPSRVLAAALAAMSGFRKTPLQRSLLGGEQGMVTLRLMGKPGRVDGINSLLKELNGLTGKNSGFQVSKQDIGRIRILLDEDSGMEGMAFDINQGLVEPLMQAVEAVAPKGLELDRPKSLPLEVGELLHGRRGPPRADRDRRSWGSGDRGSGRSGGGGGRRDDWGSRGGDRGSRGGDRDRRGGGGGYSNDRNGGRSNDYDSWSPSGGRRSGGGGGGGAGGAGGGYRDSGRDSGRGGQAGRERGFDSWGDSGRGAGAKQGGYMNGGGWGGNGGYTNKGRKAEDDWGKW